MYKKPMVAFDGSELSRRALEAGVDLAKILGVSLHTVTVVEALPPYLMHPEIGMGLDPRVVESIDRQVEDYTERRTAEIKSFCAQHGVEVDISITQGEEVEGILKAVQEVGCDLLIVGLRAHPGLLERIVAHTTQTLTNRAPCSVLGIR